MVSARSDSRRRSVVRGLIAADPGGNRGARSAILSDISTMLKQSKASEPSIATVVVNRGAMRTNTSVVSVKAGQPFSDLPGDGRRARPQRAALEVELKLGIAAEHLDILKNHPLFRNEYRVERTS